MKLAIGLTPSISEDGVGERLSRLMRVQLQRAAVAKVSLRLLFIPGTDDVRMSW